MYLSYLQRCLTFLSMKLTKEEILGCFPLVIAMLLRQMAVILNMTSPLQQAPMWSVVFQAPALS